MELCHYLETTLNPQPPTLEVCPDENYTLSCTNMDHRIFSGTGNDIIMRPYTSGIDNNDINTTDLLFSNNNMMVSNHLISIDSSRVYTLN